MVPGNPMLVYVRSGEYCYKFHGDALMMNHTAATDLCAAENAHLSFFTTEAEYDAVKYVMFKCESIFNRDKGVRKCLFESTPLAGHINQCKQVSNC